MKKKLFTLLAVALSVSAIAQRSVLPFNDGWQFKKGPFTEDPVLFNKTWNDKWTEVKVPHTWNNKDMIGVAAGFYAGESYYKTTYNHTQNSKRTFIRFEGVGQVAEVYINDVLLGRHRGGYSAFCLEMTPLLKEGDNTILVRADNSAREDIIPINHNLFGIYGGIYRPVSIIATDKINITPLDNASTGVYIRQSGVSSNSAEIEVETLVDNGNLHSSNIEVENTIYKQNGEKVTSQRHTVTLPSSGTTSFKQNFVLKKPHLWNGRKDPHLYRVETAIYSDGRKIDNVTSPLGVRSIEVRASDGVYLNGEKYPMYGVCRHQDREGFGSALTEAHHREDINLIIEIGATTVRFAHYQQSSYLYSLCDSVGLLIWAEIPFVNKVSTKEGENAKNQLTEMILQNYNHPSLYVWGLHNEVYTPTHYTATLTGELHNLAKKLDKGRYTVSVNGYGIMEHPVNQKAEIQGMNRYFGWYEGKIDDIEKWASKLEKEYPDTRFMLTEYGADGNIYHQTERLGESYNYTSKFYPETFETKTHERQWPVIKNHPYILSSYLWNMFDFSAPMWNRGSAPGRNMKGLISMDRKIKKDAFYYYKAAWSNEPVLHITERRLVDRERAVTKITVYSNQGEPTITLNGKKLTDIKRGGINSHYIIENVSLDKGNNIIEATVGNQKDSIVWKWGGVEHDGLLNNVERKEMHAGFENM